MVNSLKENAEIQTCSLDQLAQMNKEDIKRLTFSDETSEKATNESESQESEAENPQNTLDQELTLKINKQLQNFLGNFKRLGIDTSKVPTRSDWGKIVNDIKSPVDLQNISEDTIQNYLSLSDQVPQEHYYYIAENFKQILYTHLTYNPRRKRQLTGGYATGMRLDGIVGNDNYTTSTLETLQKIEKKSESEQRNYVIQHLDNPALVDFWLKSKLSTLQGGEKDEKNNQNQEKSERDLFIESFFKEIPFEKLETYFKSAEKSSFLKSLGEILLHCQAEKEGLIIKTDKFVLLDIFDLKSNLKCQKLADYSEKIGGNDQEYSFLTMMKATLEMRKMFKALGTDENEIPYIDKKILTTKEGLKVLSEFLNAQSALPQEIEKIKNYYRNLTFEVAKQYGGGQAVQGFMRAQEKEINTAKLNFEKSYVKLLLKSGHKPTGIITGLTGLKLDFSKGNNVDDIVRDSFTEQVEDGRDKFLDDLKNDKQNAFGAIGGLIGGTIGTGVMAALTGGSNPWLMSAGYTVGSRLGNGITQEARNSGERILQQCGADIKDNEAGVGVVDKNGVQDFGLSFLRGVGWLDQDYQAVGGTNFLIDLGFDYLSGVASFGLSNKVFGGEVTGFLKNTTKEITQEFFFENMIFDNPAEILKEGTKSFLHTLGHENNPGALTVMINTADELYSVENLTTTFLHTVSSCGALGAMHRPLNYVNSRLTKPIINAKLPGMEEQIDNKVAGLFKAIKENGRQMKNQELLDIKTKQPIDQNSPAFKDFQAKLKAVNELQNQYLELTKEFNDEMKEKMKNPDDPDGVKLKYGLISPFDTPMHILTAKMEIAKKELENAKKEGDLEKVKQYENLLQEYEHAKEVLREELRQKIEDGKTITPSQGNGEIIVPKGELRAPNEFFDETDEAFEHIVTDHIQEIRELDKIQNIDEFIDKSFAFLKKIMHVDPNMERKITDDNNKYSLLENKVYISRNRAGHTLKHVPGKGNKAEIFGGLAHELNHYLQRKAVILNLGEQDMYGAQIINKLQESETGHKSLQYILGNYELNEEGSINFSQALKYSQSREHYILPKIADNHVVENYNEYKGQPVEEESFRRGNIVTEAYKQAINTGNITLEYNQDKTIPGEEYFNGKRHKIKNITEKQARENSTFMDEKLESITEQNKEQYIEEIKTEIETQYKQATGKDLDLTPEQVESILDAHKKDGILGKLTSKQLKGKVKTLSESINDKEIRRFLLEAGFCGGLKAEYQDNSILNHSIQHQAFMWNRDLVQFDFDNILKVESGAFRHCSNLCKITNFHNISKIEDRSFSDTGLQEVHFGNKLEEIGEECFFGCKKLEKVSFYVGAPVREIKQRTFMCCESLKTIDLPKNISIIGNQAFLDCTSLTHLEITNPYCYLGYDVFKGCKNLKSITIPELYKGKEEDLGIPNNCNITYLPINQEIKQYISNINEHIKIKLIRFLRNIYQNTNFNNDIDKILKLTTFNGEINEDALELLIKLSNENWALDNDTYIFILQQGKGKYKEIINILDDIKYSIQINKFRIYNGTLFLDLTQFDDNEITTGRYGKIKLNNCKEYYGSENNIFNDKLHGFCTIEELLHMYTMNHCKYLDFFKESCQKNIVTDFRYSHGLRNVTDKQRGNNIYNLILQSIQCIPTEAERHALEAYKGDASYEINTQSSDRIQEGRDIENLCNKNTLKESLTVYRVEGYGGLLKKLRFSNGLTLEEAIRDQERYSQELSNVSSFIGNKLTNNFFVSTTVNAGIEGDVFVGKPIKRELNVQPGVGAYFLDLVGINPEGEVLLNRNLQYTIESIEIGHPTIIKAKVESINH